MNLVQQIGNPVKDAAQSWAVKQSSNRAQQVAEQVAGTRHGLNQKLDLVEVDDKTGASG